MESAALILPLRLPVVEEEQDSLRRSRREPKQSSKTLWRWRLPPAGGRRAEQAVFEVLEPESARHHRSGHERGQEQDGHDSHTRVRSRFRLIR
jgi:hypothetical protein